MKQSIILDRAKNETEARQIEEAKKLEQALEEAEEEARQQALAAALVSEEENEAVTSICALVRGHFGRTRAKALPALEAVGGYSCCRRVASR